MAPGAVADDATPVAKTAAAAAAHPSDGPAAPLRTVFPPLELEDHPIDVHPPVRAIVVGGGLSGITAAILLPAKVPGLDLVVYERTDDVGGVWHTNVYPGVRCDVPAHAYQSTFASSDAWTEAYARGAEIQAYWAGVADRYGARRYIKTGHRVVSATWSEPAGKWQVTVERQDSSTFVDEANFLITATGHFSDPQLPQIPGIETFAGHLRHSSHWDPAFDPAGQRVAVIGNGASGLQVLPPLQKAAAHVDHYARSPTWVAAPIGGDDFAQLVADGIDEARTSPAAYLAFRKRLEARLSSRFGHLFKDSPESTETRRTLTAKMADRLAGRPDLLDAILPAFSPNCRRLTPGPGYLEALAADNVSYITTPIARFTATGIVTADGVERPVDAVICSTGHDTSFSTQFPIWHNGVDLQAAWRPGGQPGFPDTYLGLAAPGVPNLLIVLGANSGGLSGTVPHTIELQLTYAAQVLRKAATQGIRSLAPTPEATRDFRAYCESFFPRTVASENCRSWYNGGHPGGRIHGFWPGSATHAALVRRSPRWEDWSYTYWNPQGNRFAWLGNGWAQRDIRAQAAATGSDSAAADGLDLTPWLRAESRNDQVDLRSYHEQWWE